MVLPSGCARICMANGLFGRRGILQRGPRTRGVDGVRTETSSPRGNVPREINRARLQKKPRRPLCARVQARPGSKIISSGAPAFPISSRSRLHPAQPTKNLHSCHVRLPTGPCHFGEDYVRGLQFADNR